MTDDLKARGVRTPAETLAFAAWVNCPPDAIPPEYRQHTCEATMTAWRRVVAALHSPAALSDHPTVKALVEAAVAAERERLLRPDPGFVCECGMTGPCMAENCKSPILDMTAAIRGETT